MATRDTAIGKALRTLSRGLIELAEALELPEPVKQAPVVEPPRESSTAPVAVWGVHAYRVKEFCERFRISRSKFYLEVSAGRLTVIKIGGRTIITPEDAARWLQDHRDGTFKPDKPVKKTLPGRAAGGHKRAANLSPERRREIAKNAADRRWRGADANDD